MTRLARAATGAAVAALLTGLVVSSARFPAVAAEVRYEAELATIVNGVVQRNHPGYTGTGFVNTANAVGAAVQFDVRPPTAGTPAAPRQRLLRHVRPRRPVEQRLPGDVTVTAGWATITGWTLTMRFPDGQIVDQSWNASVSSDGTTAVARDVGYNGSLAAGTSTTFGVLGTWLGANRDPEMSCAATT